MRNLGSTMKCVRTKLYKRDLKIFARKALVLSAKAPKTIFVHIQDK